jgi:hypothetical protein
MQGQAIAQLDGPSNAGLNRVLWNMRPAAGTGRGGRGVALPAADYRITVELREQKASVTGRIRERIIP